MTKIDYIEVRDTRGEVLIHVRADVFLLLQIFVERMVKVSPGRYELILYSEIAGAAPRQDFYAIDIDPPESDEDDD